MTNKKYKYWLAVVDGQLVQFSELAHMMATALHPDADDVELALCEIGIAAELKQAVADGDLVVRNPNTLGRHTPPLGNALQRAVFNPETDLEPFLNTRGIELRITPHGNGPDYWTLENAVSAMQEQLNWHDGTRAEFQDQMQEAAASRALVVLNPFTCLPYIPERVRTFWEYVTPDNVNTWLASLKAPYRWSPAPPLMTIPHKSPRDFKPWETLPQVFNVIDGVYLYQQAAREIADAEGWDDSKLEAFEAEMASAVNDGSLPIRSRKTGMVIARDALNELTLVTVDDVNDWLERKRVPYRWTLQRRVIGNASDGDAECNKKIDYTLLASRTQLIEAFRLYGVELKIFKALKDRPGLKAACRVKGRGQKGSLAEPMFCPFEVINWLVKTGVKEKPQLNEYMGWQILETKFPNVYAEKSMCDPRQS